MSVVVQRRPFSIEDFARMVDVGILGKDERVELIGGEVRQMLPIGSLHAAIVNRLNALLTERLVHRAIVSVQNPVVLTDFTEPLPDLVVLRLRDDYYRKALPRASDVILLIEVADTTLEYDRDDKVPKYARMGIPEVWLVDANGQEVTQYSRPDASSYHDVRTFGLGRELQSVEIQPLNLSVDDIFLRGC